MNDWNAILDLDLDRGRAREGINIFSDVKKTKNFCEFVTILDLVDKF